jgi:TolB-like protein/class 3 adenylate cyclase
MSEGIQRRLSAILAADVVGYSQLLGEDEAGTLSALRQLRTETLAPKVSSQRGKVVKSMGDGWLVEFASVADAVTCAIEVQEGLAENESIKLRIGVHLGDITHEDDDIYGDGVNIAARLQEIAEPGAIIISDIARRSIDGKLATAFVDLGAHTLKNISEPVTAYGWGMTSVSARANALPLPDKPSIAVLPFDNMSDDAEQEFFADGMTEDVITLLSSVPDLFVIARNSTFAYKGQSPDVRMVASDLGVRYVLEGSVRKVGNRIRVTAQFIDAESGSHIWANRYDRVLEDIFAVQDEVTQGIAGALQSRLLMAEARFLRRKPPGTLDAWGNIVNAKLKLFAYRREDIDAAEPYARRAIEIDPEYAEGYAVLGHILAWRTWNGWTSDFKQTARETLHHCEQALRLGANDPSVLTDVGFSLWWLGRQDEAVPNLQRAAALNPNSPITVAMYGYCLCAQGRPNEGLELCEKAFRLSPRDPLEYFCLHLLGAGQMHAKKFVEAKTTLEHSLQINPKIALSLAMLASVCVSLGEIDEAKTALNRAEALSTTAIPFLFRARPISVNWHEFTEPLREIYDGALPMSKN